MNSSVYIFGNLSSGYTQYPVDDYSADVFRAFQKRAKATTQIVTHREGQLMFYGYIRKLKQEKSIGLCVALNGVMITSFNNIFSLFENAIARLAENGHFIRYDETGNLVANATMLSEKQEEVELVTEALMRGFDNLARTAQKLPPEDFSVGKDSVRELCVDDDDSDILHSSHTNAYTFIYKSKDFNTAQMDSYQGVLARQKEENDALKEKIQKLEDENKMIVILKKQNRDLAQQNRELFSSVNNGNKSQSEESDGIGLWRWGCLIIIIYIMLRGCVACN